MLEEAEFLSEHQYWNTSVNKLYYPCFYAAGALLASIGVIPKTHAGTQQMFSLHFVKNGIFEKASNALYNKLFDMRQKADYEDEFDYEEADVIPLIEPAKVLIAQIKNILYPAQ